DVEGIVHVIDIATGEIRFAPKRAELTDAIPCESWAVWGVLETFGGQDHILYMATGGRVVRIDLDTGDRSVVAVIDDPGDICSFTIDPQQQRWLMHVEQDSQFSATSANETLISCPASICVDNTCTCASGTGVRGVQVCPNADGPGNDACKDTDDDADNCGSC